MKRTQLFLTIIQVPVDYLMLLFAALTAYGLRLSDWAIALKPIQFQLTVAEFFALSAWAAVIWIAIFAIAGLYSTNPNKKFAKETVKIVLACTVGLAAIALYVLFTQQLFDSRFLIGVSWMLSIPYIIVGRLIVQLIKSVLHNAGIGLRQVVIVGDDEMTMQLVDTFADRPSLGYRVMARYKQFTPSVQKKIRPAAIDEIIFTNPRDNQDQALRAMDFCHEHHLVFKYSADLFSSYASHRTVHPLAGVPIVELKRTRLDGWGRVLKRLADVVMSLVLLVLLSPVFAGIWLFLRLESKGPVIYKNERIGFRGETFMVYKFRSMYVEYCTGSQFGEKGKRALKKEQALIAKQNTRKGPIYKVGNDPRITPIGKVLRRFSLDELPQFVNVLLGTMSIVGPRPHQPREVEGYVKEHKKVFSVKPGITGLAQISGRSDLPYAEEVRLDVFYIEHWHPFLDMIIFLKTPFILLKRRKAL